MEEGPGERVRSLGQQGLRSASSARASSSSAADPEMRERVARVEREGQSELLFRGSCNCRSSHITSPSDVWALRCSGRARSRGWRIFDRSSSQFAAGRRSTAIPRGESRRPSGRPHYGSPE